MSTTDKNDINRDLIKSSIRLLSDMDLLNQVSITNTLLTNNFLIIVLDDLFEDHQSFDIIKINQRLNEMKEIYIESYFERHIN